MRDARSRARDQYLTGAKRIDSRSGTGVVTRRHQNDIGAPDQSCDFHRIELIVEDNAHIVPRPLFYCSSEMTIVRSTRHDKSENPLKLRWKFLKSINRYILAFSRLICADQHNDDISWIIVRTDCRVRQFLNARFNAESVEITMLLEFRNGVRSLSQSAVAAVSPSRNPETLSLKCRTNSVS